MHRLRGTERSPAPQRFAFRHSAGQRSRTRWFGPTHQGIAGLDTPRRLEGPRAVHQDSSGFLRGLPGSTRYSVRWWVFGAVACRSALLLSWPVDGYRGCGGDEETRTPDPLLAKEMLFQLSYVPLTPRRRSV